ncbi:uncharacterized protein PpBr36_09551 [Pyricularia pennisetigena]|uniref:uncharacterized protein n=1 Tax=Pyricularia pennisetigena TaxID=1578925 RepID=UPI001150A6D2|nr:uncharacterized protein PpBr36_09551 [Pyricularia pennisetigena]TLS21613.1 hypothetical protein PpBr36_09551 [Pyricularia pennisetigena]
METIFQYPHPNCFVLVNSTENFWYYFKDIYSVDNALLKRRTFNFKRSTYNRVGLIRFVKKRKIIAVSNPAIAAAPISE